MPRVAVMVAMEEEALYLRPLIAGEDGGTTEVRPIRSCTPLAVR